MMPGPDDAIPRTCDHDLRELKNRVVCVGELSVGRETLERRILQITLDYVSQIAQFLRARAMWFDFLRLQQGLPAHGRLL